MIDLMKLEPSEAERIAYAEGFTGTAALFARLSDAEAITSDWEDLLPVRYFIIDYDLDDGPDIVECDEHDFLRAEGVIEYKRHTIRENGVNQICLTKVEPC